MRANWSYIFSCNLFVGNCSISRNDHFSVRSFDEADGNARDVGQVDALVGKLLGHKAKKLPYLLLSHGLPGDMDNIETMNGRPAKQLAGRDQSISCLGLTFCAR